MKEECTVYCLDEACRYCVDGNAVFGKCNHPVHQSLRPCDARRALSLETCPWTSSISRYRNISPERKEQLRDAATFPSYPPRIGYIFRAKGSAQNILCEEMRLLDVRMLSRKENANSHRLSAQTFGKTMALQSFCDMKGATKTKGRPE